jgi:hypothetical protein
MNRRSFLALLGAGLGAGRLAVTTAIASPSIEIPAGWKPIIPPPPLTPGDVWIPYSICDNLSLPAGSVDEILFPPPHPEEFLVSALSILASKNISGLRIEARMGEYLMMEGPLELLMYGVGGLIPSSLYPPWAFNAEHPMSLRLQGTADSEMQIHFSLHGAIKATFEQAARWAEAYNGDDDEDDEDQDDYEGWDEDEEYEED